MTPEGLVKKKIKDVLIEQKVYYFMPVQSGYGAAGLDFHCVVMTKVKYPMPFFVEAKRKGGMTTPRQDNLIARLRTEFQVKVWIIDSDRDISELELWLQTIRGV